MNARFLALVLLASVCFKVCGQTNVYDFSTSLGSGSFTLDTNNLSFPNNTGGYATSYFDSKDTFTFNGTTYHNLFFSVIDDYDVDGTNFIDGFGVQTGMSGPGSTMIALSEGGNNSIVNGTSISDLLTVLNSFQTLNSGNFFGSSISYQDGTNPEQIGSLNSLELVPTPEPSIWSLTVTGVMIGLFCFRGVIVKFNRRPIAPLQK